MDDYGGVRSVIAVAISVFPQLLLITHEAMGISKISNDKSQMTNKFQIQIPKSKTNTVFALFGHLNFTGTPQKSFGTPQKSFGTPQKSFGTDRKSTRLNSSHT